MNKKIENKCQNIIMTNSLSDMQQNEIKNLIIKCQNYDRFKYDYYFEKGPITNGPTPYYLYYNEKNNLLGFLSLYYIEEDFSQIYPFVHPDYRRNGIFKELFYFFLEQCSKDNLKLSTPVTLHTICIGIKSNCNIQHVFPVLSSLHFELNHSEYMMEKNYSILAKKDYKTSKEILNSFNSNHKRDDKACNLQSLEAPKIELEYEDNEYGHEFSLWIGDNYIGGCLVEFARNLSFCSHNSSESPKALDFKTATIYEFGIVDTFQGKGYGKKGFILICNALKNMYCNKIILQVSSDNKKAHSLYTDCGFHIISGIDYYRYHDSQSN